jgi:hypothetical protein
MIFFKNGEVNIIYRRNDEIEMEKCYGAFAQKT